MPKISYLAKKKEVDNPNTKDVEIGKNVGRELMICAEKSVSSKQGCYILALCGTQCESEFRIAAASSNCTSTVYSVGNGFTKITSLDYNGSPIVGIKFSQISKNILYVAMRDGLITACDLRAKGKIVAMIRDSTPDSKIRPFSSFDISNDDRFAVAGSEHTDGDAFILFWDLRYFNGRMKEKCDLLGGYWESHIGDITSLSFHPTQQDFLASGSTDGLINVFDLTKNSEELALRYSLNTESSVDRLGWLDNGNIWCTTHPHELQLWDYKDAQPYGKFDREVIGTFMNSPRHSSYVVKMHNNNASGKAFLLAGSASDNHKLSGLIVDDNDLETCYDLPGNKQLVRDSWYHNKSGCLVTGGEQGMLNLWKENEKVQQNKMAKSSPKLGEKKRDQQQRPKPY